MNKTILMISQYTPQPQYTGGLRYYDWARYLISRGYRVYLLCGAVIHNSDIDLLEKNEKYRIVKDPSGINYVYVKTKKYEGNGLSRIINMISFYFSVMKVFKKLPKPDLIISRSPNPLACVAGIRIARKINVPSIVDIVDLWPESIVVYMNVSAKNPIIKLLYKGEKWIYKKSTAIIFTDEGDYDYIKEKGWEKDIPKEKAFYVNIGVNIEQFDYNKTHKSLEDPMLQKKDIFKVAYTGSVRLVNNLKILIDAGKILKERGVNDVFIMIHGAGDQVEMLRKYCKKNGIDNVKLYGRIEKEQIPYVLTHADLCVLCYQDTPLLRFGGSMNKMFEFLASGRPVIANAKMGYSLIERYNCGIEIGSNDSAKLADEIIRFKNMDAEERASYGKRGRAAAEEYDINKLCKKMFDVLMYAEDKHKCQK
ncbi:MAG: glycosyltransferase family 4 protein [Lachnospiraceae bacterium]|jgi:glycosyltransferase involved in cell wall biosynthesis|nr:glycosyltransferase family 4 protein [Lachnospiraceae bacterium]